jgi:hypothetical protein
MFEAWLTGFLDDLREPHRELLDQFAPPAPAAQTTPHRGPGKGARLALAKAAEFLAWLDTCTALESPAVESAWHRPARLSASPTLDHMSQPSGVRPTLYVHPYAALHRDLYADNQRVDVAERRLENVQAQQTDLPPTFRSADPQ